MSTFLNSLVSAPSNLYQEIKGSFAFNNDEHSHHRFLDHTRGPDAPLDGKNLTLRAAVTPDGYCVEYRETLFQHFMRVALWFAKQPYRISPMQIGISRGVKIYGIGR